MTAIPTDKPFALLGVPTFGDLTTGAARGAFKASRGDRLNYSIELAQSSLLALNFNRLWCRALNFARGGRVDYFAMQHGDIEPELWWLDKLVGEMEARDLDVLGVVAPIKDARGLTSVALDGDPENPWQVHARLSMREVFRLPETFTAADLGRPLLLNTGLWVCRFDPAWAGRVHFEINDAITRNPDGEFVALNEPEDWGFSRRLNALGLRVGCTRKVALGHRGPAVFGNTHPWGQMGYDESLGLTRSVLDADRGEDWFPHRAAGWLTEAEGAELARRADGKSVLEVGSYCGRSTVCLARTARTVTAVDTFDGRGTAAEGDTLGTFRANLERYGVADKVTAVRGASAEVLPDLPPVYDLAFIDGSHDYESVKADAANAARCLRPGGVIAFHDYSDRDPGVVKLVDELLAGGAELLGRCDSLAVVRPAPATPQTPSLGA